MKFTVRVSNFGGARSGFASELGGRHRDRVVLESPACFVHTRKGSVPHLTVDVLRMVIGQESLPMVVPFVFGVESHESIKKFSRGIGEFTSLTDHVLYSSVQDPAFAVPSGYNNKYGVSVWPKTGRVHVDVGKFMQVQEALQVDIYQALCDSDVKIDDRPKRIAKSVDRSLQFLDECLSRHELSDKLKNTAVFGSVQGGYDTKLRKKSAKLTALRPVDGFVIEGLSNYGPEGENLRFEDIHSILLASLEDLPSDKPRVLHGIWKPGSIVQAVSLGIDLFDSSYPNVLAERGIAFVLPLKKFESRAPSSSLAQNEVEDVAYELNLLGKSFVGDFSPLMDDCKCYACRKFTRAYVNHLLNTSEMLAQVLLMMHNLHHYLRFFRVIRRTLSEDRYENFQKYVLSLSRDKL